MRSYREAMKALEAAGTERGRRRDARRGVPGPTFGVSATALGRLKRSVGVDQALASRLWASGHHDARRLAAAIADPAALSSADLERWAKDLDGPIVADAFAALVAESRHAKAKMKRWTRLKSDAWRGRAGWMLLARLAERRDDAVGDRELASYPRTVVARIRGARPAVREGMLRALVAIAHRGGELATEATEAAKAIGEIEIEGGDGPTTIDAVAAIEEAGG